MIHMCISKRLFDYTTCEIRVKDIGVTLGVLKRGKRKFLTYKITGTGRRKVSRGTVPFPPIDYPSSLVFLLTPHPLLFNFLI